MTQEKKDIMERLTRLSGLLHHYQMTNLRHFGPIGNPHRGQGRVLSILKMQPEISQKELGYLLDMRNQSLGEILSKLEKSGFITRTPSEEDRRTANIKLTPEGAQAASQMDIARQEECELFTSLDEAERRNLTELLDRVIAEMEEKMEGFDFPKGCHPHMPPHGHHGPHGERCGHFPPPDMPHFHGPHGRHRHHGPGHGRGHHAHDDMGREAEEETPENQ